MKQTVQMQEIQDRMKPGRLIRDGFLGTDVRNLVDILEDDDVRVIRMGLTHKIIAEKMIYFKEKGLSGLGEFIDVEPYFEVRVDTVRGKLPCPFGDPGILSKINITVRNKKIKKEITYTEFNIHLIYVHGFYEGKGSLFRINPENITEVLEIKG